MKLKNILTTYSDKPKLISFIGRKGYVTTTRLSSYILEPIQSYCAKNKIAVRLFIKNVDIVNDGATCLSEALKAVSFFIRENPDDEIIF